MRTSRFDNTCERSQMNSTTISISTKAKNRVNPEQASSSTLRIVNVAFDVGSESLHWAMEVPGQTLSGECTNTSSDIRKTLQHIRGKASHHGYDEVRVICESTGIYHRRLLQLADSLGMRTCLVHAEAVAKFRTIQFADHVKTDARDPRATLTVAKVGKLIKDRKLDKHYSQMRELHRLVLRCEARIKVAKCELHAELRNLFTDLQLDKLVMYGPTGRALVEEFAGNPHRIVATGEETFCATMKARS